MGIAAAPTISNQSVNPVSRSGGAAVKLGPEFLPSFEPYLGNEDQEINDDEKQKDRSSEATTSKNESSGSEKAITTEFFKLLKKYHFKDFLQLALCNDDLKLATVIKKNRTLRGVSMSLPFSNEHAQNNNFINQVKDQYLHTNWLMKGKPGKLYTGIL
jgi:hypothetical protein